MIIDKFKNLSSYASMLQSLKEGYKEIKKLDRNNLEVGRYEFNGGFFMVQKGVTKPMEEGNFEAHRKYVDVQIVIEGSEDVAWADLSDLTEVIPYNEEKDAVYYSGDTSHYMTITEGMCYVAFPHDGHRAIRHVKEQTSFTKIVMKLPV